MSSATGQEHVQQILRDVVSRLDPRKLVAEAIKFGDELRIDGINGAVPMGGKLVIVAVGKASIPMAAGALDQLGDRVTSAVAITKGGLAVSGDPPDGLEIIEADHPVPTEKSLGAGARVR
ncbi:MAG: DUF4147 domain-containing protein, partial [Thermomicrobiaceae bacterium]